jgi:beta propeller repeat protein
MKRLFEPFVSLAGRTGRVAAMTLLAALAARDLPAQQQYQGFCAYVKIEILQELTLERIGFLATLEVTNNDAVDPITGFTAGLRFTEPKAGNIEDDATDRFWVRQPELININGVDGDGNIAPGAKATVKWFIVPKTGAGGESPGGIRYYVHCDLAGSMRGAVIPENVMFAIPDMITVKPEPELEITYFQPRDVQGDDPFTAQVEAPVPFTLGVLVKNVGYGKARSVVIRSEQPRIVENKQLLLLVAQLIGCRVMDAPLDRSSLTVNIGDIDPGRARVAAWDMITSLSGTFTEFKASYTHAPEFGGEETSLLRPIQAHFIVHEVLDDRVGRDTVRDFLADTDRDAAQMPDGLYTSAGELFPVNIAPDARIVSTAPNGFVAEAVPITEGAAYFRVNDPAQSKRKLARVTRADGSVLNANNAWTSIRYIKEGNQRFDEFHLFDFMPTGNNTYTVEYEANPVDSTPPATSMEFSGPSSFAGGKYYVTPDTQLYFLSQDANPVSIEYMHVGVITNWAPAFPFSLPLGEHAIVFRATDSELNVESAQTNAVVVLDPSSTAAEVTLTPNRAALSLLADLVSARPGNVSFAVGVTESPVPLAGCVEVFSSVRAWPQLSGLPATPARPGTFTLRVMGQDAEFYKFRVNSGAWSAERPVAQTFEIDGSAPGTYAIEVLARAACDTYPDAAEALSAVWAVAPDAPETVLTEAPPHPNTRPYARFAAAGEGVATYRWTLGNNYIRPSLAAGAAFVISNLTAGSQEVRLFPNLPDGVHTNAGYNAYAWTNSVRYGYDAPAAGRVRLYALGSVNSGTNVTWDGKNDQGTQVVPGWYTVRVSVSNALGQLVWSKTRVRVEEVGASDREVAPAESGVQRMQGRGAYAVWTDRSGVQWQIRSRNVDAGGSPFAVTAADATQDDPYTDGRYAVWQGRQADSTWAVYWADLADVSRTVHVLSALPDADETNPVMDWPWAVWQVKDVRTSGAPSQLFATNFVTGVSRFVSPTTQDQLDACVSLDRVVWQDWRDVGPGEIYFQDLETGEQRRLTANTAGQYKPAFSGPFVVWQDNRDGNLELYAHDLRNRRETRLTSTAYDEANPVLTGDWLLYTENSLGADLDNLRLMHLPTLRTAPMTRTPSRKRCPALLAQYSAWIDTVGGAGRVVAGPLPSVRAVYAQRNAVPVTEQMADTFGSAFNLIRSWNTQAHVVEVLVYDQLWPAVISRRAWRSPAGEPGGEDFQLVAGQFIWMGFDRSELIDFGPASGATLNLPAGASVVTFTDFPMEYSAFRMARQIGLDNLRAVRMFDPGSGQWKTVEVIDGGLVGEDFAIPRIAVMYFDMVSPVSGWRPE